MRWAATALAAAYITACASTGGPYDAGYVTRANAWLRHFEPYPARRTVRGKASYYHDSLAGNHTANGEVYDLRLLTAANRTLPFGTVVRVVREDDGRHVIVRVNDRGPFGSRERILDLSRAAAAQLGILRKGVVRIRAEILWQPPR